jgi:hypothetical protein
LSRAGWYQHRPSWAVQVVDGALGVAAGGDDGPAVGGEDRQPVGEVGGVVVAGGLDDPELGAPERCAEFGDEFLSAVGAVTEPARQVATEPGGVAGPVGVLLSAPRWLLSSDSCCPPAGGCREDSACAGGGRAARRLENALRPARPNSQSRRSATWVADLHSCN